MRVVRLRSGRAHFVLDGSLTYCGRLLIDLPVTEEIEREALPPDEPICVRCEGVAGSELIPDTRVTLPPSYGVLRKTGPLIHGFKDVGNRRASRLPRHSGG